jgi:phospholipid-binding lipoprotein MlaA
MTMFKRHTLAITLFLALVGLTACASTTTTAQASEGEIADPFESYNRVIFSFNDAIDETIIVPIAKGYRAVVPQPVRTGVHNVLTNLKSPVTIGNQLLQGDLDGTGRATVRMVVNTIIGVGGIFDVAGSEGIKDEPEDFGQTMAVWGVGHGPYMVAPFLPPGSLRDYTGQVVDGYADPVRLWLHNTDREGLYYARFGLSVLDTRTSLLDALADLKKNSIDYYATVRSAYVQRRIAQVRDESVDATDIPNYAAGDQ